MAYMFTRWGKEILKQRDADTVVLPEYPRPTLVRSSFWNLNGYWDYAISALEEVPGLPEGKILVPFSPEAALSGVRKTVQPEDVLHVFRTWELEHREQEGHYLLHFGAVDERCRVYVNGILAGQHEGGYLPFTLDVTKLLKEGGNRIWLVIRDESEKGPHSRGKQRIDRGGMWYTAQSGIWQTVWMEWVPESYVSRLQIEPDLDLERVTFLVRTSDKKKTMVEAVILVEGEEVCRCSFPAGKPYVCLLPKVYEWSPADPVLYDVRFTVGEDSFTSYFALRTITVERDYRGVLRFCLNHKPYFQTGVLDQGYYPDGLYTAPSDEAMVEDIQLVKRLGFNMIRKHVKIEPERWYYHCDRLGMLVWQDMVNGGVGYRKLFTTILPNVFPFLGRIVRDTRLFYSWFGRGAQKSRQEFYQEVRQTIDHLRSHPSIVCWVPFNEGWGQFDARQVTSLIRDTDPTRLVDQASGWFDQGGGDVYSIHNYFRKLSVSPKKNRVVALTECGGYSWRVKGHSQNEEAYGYRKYTSGNELTAGIMGLWERELIPAVDLGLSASIFTQLSDIEDEINGLITYDRAVVKVDEKMMRKANRKLLREFARAVEF